MLSMLANRNLPSATLFVLNGSRCLGRVVKSLSPRRRPSLTMSLSLHRGPAVIARSRHMSSGVNVVLMHPNIRLLMQGYQGGDLSLPFANEFWAIQDGDPVAERFNLSSTLIFSPIFLLCFHFNTLLPSTRRLSVWMRRVWATPL